MNNKRRNGVSYPVLIILMLISFAVGAGTGISGWIYVMGGSGEASRTADQAIAEIETDNTVEQPTGTTFSIVAEQSEASFTLEEDLRGVRTTVVGITSEIGGTINVDLANPAASTIGTIAINARTLTTDQEMRNRMIRSEILKSAQDQFEFIIFEPTSLSNFSAETVGVGETITFDITGDLTIAGVRNLVTFNASVTLDSDTQISGTATATVQRADYGLVIPSVSQVANVTEDVDLALDFVAIASES